MTVDATVVGAGPNGLAAAIILARAGRSVRLVEARETIGGGLRSHEPFGPGITVDHCASAHPLGRGSPVFGGFGLERFGLEWVEPTVQLAHPFDDGSAVLVDRDIDATTASFGSATDARRYAAWMRPVAARWDRLIETLVGPLRPSAILRDPLIATLVGAPAVLPAGLVARLLSGPRARGLVAGCAAHSFLSLGSPLTATFGLILLASLHAVGWPLVRGGSQGLADALAAALREAGGEIETGHEVRSLDELEGGGSHILDLSPRGVLSLAGDRLGGSYAAQLRRYRYGPGAYKVDFLTDAAVPWQADGVERAGTVHLGGTLEEIEASEAAIGRGRISERPFVIAIQPTRVDRSRAPDGRHLLWTYCHVPNGFDGDITDRIRAQVERFAPGFTDTIVAEHVTRPADFEADDVNLVGGDINGGLMDWRQFLTRPAIRRDPYSTPDPGIFICSASTPPGGGVHGLNGHFAARSVLART